MVIQYSATPTGLTQAPLPDDVLASIGRLVRAFAEIDDLITLYLCNLAQVSESRAAVILGRTPGAVKLNMAAVLAKMTGKIIHGIHGTLFNEGYREYRKYRNAVAHGVYIGVTDEGKYAFLTSEINDPEEATNISQVVYCFEKKEIGSPASCRA